jgi:hypothetical protein
MVNLAREEVVFYLNKLEKTTGEVRPPKWLFVTRFRASPLAHGVL